MPSFSEQRANGAAPETDANGVEKTNGHSSKPEQNSLPVPSNSFGTVEIPATRESVADAAPYMQKLSMQPSMKDRRGSRNSFGASLPIPRSKRQSRLSSVTNAFDGELQRPGMPPIQASRDVIASHLQDQRGDTVLAAKDMAFVFDIDGVLVHGDRLIPEGKKALEILNGDNELGIKIPHIFLTNGSGKPEQARCDQLTKILGNKVDTDQFIQAHTPMSALAEYYETVLIVGGEYYRCRDVAEQYGFKNIIVPNEIVAWDKTIAPLRANDYAEKPWDGTPRDFSKVNIDAIMVFSDSRDYSTDMQIIIDLLRSENGRLGTVAKDPTSQRIPIYFSQGDVLNPTEHPIPRLTQGTFRIALEAMYKAITGIDLERTIYGKPELATYKYADEVLASWMEKLHKDERLPKNIYMVGDNPASDIIGGNMYGWNTCLVRTGVFQGGDNDENNPANFGVFANVLEAVQTALRKELGQDFQFNFDAEKHNPLRSGNGDVLLGVDDD